MKKLIMTLALLIQIEALAEDKWFCTDDQSKRTGNVYQICGVGEAVDEGTARINAIDAAMYEFHKMCDISDTCNKHELDVEPMRTTCELGPPRLYVRRYKCHRMIKITVGDSK